MSKLILTRVFSRIFEVADQTELIEKCTNLKKLFHEYGSLIYFLSNNMLDSIFIIWNVSLSALSYFSSFIYQSSSTDFFAYNTNFALRSVVHFSLLHASKPLLRPPSPWLLQWQTQPIQMTMRKSNYSIFVLCFT